ncbi:MAG: glycoside hydrolase domain-containing protein [Flavisolibacter sp.]
MKQILISLVFLVFCAGLRAQEISYGTCDSCWNADSLGNHRAVVQFEGEGPVARVVIQWRRRDRDPQNKNIIVEDAATGKRIWNVWTGRISREEGDIFFEPLSGRGQYYVYYLPYKNEGRSNYPKGIYPRPQHTADTGWLAGLRQTVPVNSTVRTIQAIDAFNSFYPMEVIATARETEELKMEHPGKGFLVFAEDRLHSIRMQKDLPFRWIRKGVSRSFSGEASRGENFSYQIGVYALRNLGRVQLDFTSLQSENGHSIPAKNIFCLNTRGVNYDGKAFVKEVDLPAGGVQPMWCCIQVPRQTAPGIYKGLAIVRVQGLPSWTVHIQLRVNPRLLKDGGVNEPWKMTRLPWLNSTLAQKNDVIAPYRALQVKGHGIDLLGRRMILGKNGLPEQIQTFFTPEMTGYTSRPNNILAFPISWCAEDNGKPIGFTSTGIRFTSRQAGTVKWISNSSAPGLKMEVKGSLEFDGFVSYQVRVTALRNVSFSNTGMRIPFTPSVAKYMMGLGQKGGFLPKQLDWSWDVAHKNQDGAWIGNVNAGLQFSLRDENYIRPLNTNFYLQKPLVLPSSWGNEGRGGIQIREEEGALVVHNFTGPRRMKKGEVLYYNFTLLLTPFHPLQTDFQWETRFYHKYNDPDSIRATGATVANIHHGTPINPWINYPFIESAKMKAFIDESHQKGLKVKIYNTVRELSNHAYEVFALRSLGHEIFAPGKGGGFSWLQEHMDSDYIAAWFVPEIKDAALVNSGLNRWHNYYVEGMNWLVSHTGIDGIYLDDVAFDRITMKRIKRVLTQKGHPGIIDLHSANQYNKNDGFNNSANLYMEHFPYLNRLWFGEYFDYEKNPPEFFLTEISGIPFGLMGEMLEGGGNPWRGMIYGMTNRMPWTQNADPRPLWKLWDQFGMKGTEMIGYWSGRCPVTTDHPQVLATVYKKKGSALISLASWAKSDTVVHLKIDWDKLGLDPSKVILTAPAVQDFQPARTFQLKEGIPVGRGKGWLLLLGQR